jgi:hypothetical protein
MPRLERWLPAALLLAGAAQASDDTLLRHRAPINIDQRAALVRLPLSIDAYARSQRGPLDDLRVVDASGQRVPFALLAPRPDEVQTRDTWRDAKLYPLPPRPARGEWTAPVDLTVDGSRITLRTRGQPVDGARSPGWLVDLGERVQDERPPARLQLAWRGPAEFSTPYTLEHSNDLRAWRGGGSGQVMALASTGGALTQPDVPLPADVGRFVRIVWGAPAPFPQLTGARAATPATRSRRRDAPSEFTLIASPEPPSVHAGQEAERALHFDLGAVVPVVQLAATWSGGTRLLPVRVQARERTDAPWRTLAGTVLYRLEQGGAVQQPPPLGLQTQARYVRLVPDERAGAVARDELCLVVRAELASLVFAAQGQAPYALLAGSAQAAPGALPLATVVPDLERERERFGRATLGPWSEVSEAAAQARRQERQAALRPWLLWSVLAAGVLGLGVMVWRLARAPSPQT